MYDEAITLSGQDKIDKTAAADAKKAAAQGRATAITGKQGEQEAFRDRKGEQAATRKAAAAAEAEKKKA